VDQVFSEEIDKRHAGFGDGAGHPLRHFAAPRVRPVGASPAAFRQRLDPPGASGFHRQRRRRRGDPVFPRPLLPVQTRRPGIGGIGVSRLNASGNVYNLCRLQDFEGVYGQARTGWSLGEQGKGQMWLQNGNGVYLRLKAQRQGLSLSLGADGMVVRLGS
jgi:hypothetical protein